MAIGSLPFVTLFGSEGKGEDNVIPVRRAIEKTQPKVAYFLVKLILIHKFPTRTADEIQCQFAKCTSMIINIFLFMMKINISTEANFNSVSWKNVWECFCQGLVLLVAGHHSGHLSQPFSFTSPSPPTQLAQRLQRRLQSVYHFQQVELFHPSIHPVASPLKAPPKTPNSIKLWSPSPGYVHCKDNIGRNWMLQRRLRGC